MPLQCTGSVVSQATLGRQHLLTIAAPELARQAQPGQFALLRCSAGWDPYLRRALPFLRTGGDTISFLFDPRDAGLAWLAERPLGAAVDLLGPLGHGFDLHPTTRHLLLAAAGEPIAPLLALADVALARNCSVSLLGDATILPLPVSIIAEAIELLEGSLVELAPQMLPWADQVAVTGPVERVQRLVDLRPVRQAGFLQYYAQAHLACGLGWCGSCLTDTRRGPRRTCTSGPVFDLLEMA